MLLSRFLPPEVYQNWPHNRSIIFIYENTFFRFPKILLQVISVMIVYPPSKQHTALFYTRKQAKVYFSLSKKYRNINFPARRIDAFSIKHLHYLILSYLVICYSSTFFSPSRQTVSKRFFASLFFLTVSSSLSNWAVTAGSCNFCSWFI